MVDSLEEVQVELAVVATEVALVVLTAVAHNLVEVVVVEEA